MQNNILYVLIFIRSLEMEKFTISIFYGRKQEAYVLLDAPVKLLFISVYLTYNIMENCYVRNVQQVCVKINVM